MATGDLSRRPSNERVRVEVAFDAMVWVECDFCCGDGWHLTRAERAPAKITCGVCHGVGAIQMERICCGPNSRILSAPRGWAAKKVGAVS